MQLRATSRHSIKFGINWEFQPNHFVCADIARSTEVPNADDISSLLTLQQTVDGLRPGTANMVDVVAVQRAWTSEIGVRGGFDRFRYDVAVYDMRLEDEILSACALNFISLSLFMALQQAQAARPVRVQQRQQPGRLQRRQDAARRCRGRREVLK